MTLICVLTALAINYFAAGLSDFRDPRWFHEWTRRLAQKLHDSNLWRGALGVVVVLSPPVFIAALLQYWLADAAFGLLGFAYAVFVLVWGWGPHSLDSDVKAYLQAARTGDSNEQRRAAARLVPGELPANSEDEANTVVAWVYLGALERWFGVLFWFVLLGPMGAVLYRLAHQLADCADEDTRSDRFTAAARRLRRLLDWPVCLLMALGLAIVGHFDAVIHAWRDYYRREGKGLFALDPGYLLAAARATLASPPPGWGAEESAHETACQQVHLSLKLMWRVLFVWLTVLAFCTIAGWLA